MSRSWCLPSAWPVLAAAQWGMTETHKPEFTAVRSVEKRAPLLVLSGDVGTGKTELAETVCAP